MYFARGRTVIKQGKIGARDIDTHGPVYYNYSVWRNQERLSIPGQSASEMPFIKFSVTYAAARTSAGEVRENTEQIDKTRFIMEVT